MKQFLTFLFIELCTYIEIEFNDKNMKWKWSDEKDWFMGFAHNTPVKTQWELNPLNVILGLVRRYEQFNKWVQS